MFPGQCSGDYLWSLTERQRKGWGDVPQTTAGGRREGMVETA